MGSSSTFGNNEKLVHLVRAVSTVPELRQIKTTADMLAVSTGTVLSFDKYYELLSSAAAQYEAGLKNKPKRLIYSHAIDNDDDYYESLAWEYENGESYDIDTPVSYIEANVHARPPRKSNQRPKPGSINRRVLLPKERWTQLSDDAQATWDTLSDEEKAIILGYPSSGPTALRHQDNAPEAEPPPPEEEIHDTQEPPTSETRPPDDPLEAHESKQAPSFKPKYPPYDIRAILSQKSKYSSKT